LAHGGTLFLDEIGNVPASQQGKLLRGLETGEVERVGSSRTIRADARILSPPNAAPPAEGAAGRVRPGPALPLNPIAIASPPLRERREDTPALAQHFLGTHARRYRKPITGFEPGALDALLAHSWPGNVRELDHAVERAVLMAAGDRIRAADLALRRGGDAARL